MMLKLVILLFSMNIFASPWQSMNPLLHCSEVTLEFKSHKDAFKVRIPKQDSYKFYIETTIRDLNDLSDLTEVLNLASSEYCPAYEVVENFDFGNSVCTTQERQYTPKFIDLFRSITTIVNSDSNSICSNIIPFIKLQDEISELTEDDFVKPKKTKRLTGKLLKLLTDSDTDKLIDHFFACGGKRGSSSFIKNLILLNVKDACIAPKPEGSLDWSEAEKIADEISSKYESMSLLKIQKKQKEITKDAVSMFANKITKDQLKNLLSPYFKEDIDKQTDNFLNNLESYKKLQIVETDDLPTYVNYIFAVEAPIEIGEKVLPLIVNHSFKERLPKTWSEEKKRDFTQKTLIPEAIENYKACLSDEISYSGINKSFIGEKDKIHYRASLKINFCDTNPHLCPENSCSSSVNYLSLDETSTDTQRVQGCVVQSMTKSIKPYLEKIIEEQKETFKDDFDLTPKMTKSLSESTWSDLTSCLNDKLDSKESILDNPKALRSIDTALFEKYVGECGDFAQQKVSRKFVSLILLNNDALKVAYSDGSSSVDEYGIERSNNLIAVTQKVITDAYTPCMNSISGSKDATLCTPSIEMKAASMVIEKSLSQKNPENRPELNLIIKEFRACTNQSLDNSFKNIQNSTSATPITSKLDAKTYLDRNPEFFRCIQTSIADSSYIIAGVEFEKTIGTSLERVKNKTYLKNQKSLVQAEIRECFNSELEKIGKNKPWESFLTFNKNDGLTTLQNKCEKRATSLVIANVVIKEAISALDPLVSNKFFNNRNQIFNILTIKANALKAKYSIEIPSSVKQNDRTHYIFRNALLSHLKEGKTTESFLDDITKNLESDTVGVIHQNLIQKVAEPQFSSSFDKACLFGLYKITQTDTKPSDDPISMDKLTDYLKVGIKVYKEQGNLYYKNKMDEIKKECRDINKFSNNSEFQKSHFYELIIKGQIQTLFKDQLQKGILDNLREKISELEDPYKDIKLLHANKMLTSMEKLLNNAMTSKRLYSNLFTDNKVMKFALDNIEGLLNSSESEKKGLSKILISKMFGDADFADSFVKIQVLGNFGVSAIEQTFEQATKGKKLLWGSITLGSNAGKKAAETYFNNLANIENLIDWERIPKSNRSIMINSVINDGVLATVEKGTFPSKMNQFFSNKETQEKVDESVDRITNGYKNYSKNIEKEARNLAATFIVNPFTKAQRIEFFKAKLHKTHMDRNVEGILMSHEYKDQETIKDRITDDISSLGNDFFWGSNADEDLREPALEKK